MWNNAGLSTSILIGKCAPGNGIGHHSLAKIFISTKLRDFGPRTSLIRMFRRLVATRIRYQPSTAHLLRDLTTFSLASVQAPCIGTVFLGLAPITFLKHSHHLDDAHDIPPILPICADDACLAIRDEDVLRIAVATALPPVSQLETVLLSLKEGELLSESTVRRLRRREAERRAAAAEGRTPLSEYKRRKQKKKEAAARQSTALTELLDSERLKVTVEDTERLAASASLRRRRDCPSSTSLWPAKAYPDVFVQDPISRK